jgi:TM2 domain-containing membrane protein YozV
MSAFPDWAIFTIVTTICSIIMYAGYLMGREAGLDKGFQAGFDLGKGVGRREVASQ